MKFAMKWAAAFVINCWAWYIGFRILLFLSSYFRY